MSEWQPIETAPKDGTPIVGWPAYSWSLDRDIPYVMRWEGESKFPGWREAAGEVYESYEPTHWQPLPSPPKAPVERVGG